MFLAVIKRQVTTTQKEIGEKKQNTGQEKAQDLLWKSCSGNIFVNNSQKPTAFFQARQYYEPANMHGASWTALTSWRSYIECPACQDIGKSSQQKSKKWAIPCNLT